MAAIPDTRISLIGRLSDFEDRQAWDEFVTMYRPVIYALAVRSGLQASDADDAVQEVLWAVGRSVAKWQPDPTRARFRTWLGRITRNLVINLLAQQRRRPWKLNDVDLQGLLEVTGDPNSDAESREFELAFRRQAFAMVASKVQRRIQPQTWAAFRRTAIDGAPVTIVAEELGWERGMVYVARCRVMRMLREEVERLEQDASADYHGVHDVGSNPNSSAWGVDP